MLESDSIVLRRW